MAVASTQMMPCFRPFLGSGTIAMMFLWPCFLHRGGEIGASADAAQQRTVEQALLRLRQVAHQRARVLEHGAQYLAHFFERRLVELLIGVDAGMQRHGQDRPVAPVHDADLVLVGGVEDRVVGLPHLGLGDVGVDAGPHPAPARGDADGLAFVHQGLEGRFELVVECRVDVRVVSRGSVPARGPRGQAW